MGPLMEAKRDSSRRRIIWDNSVDPYQKTGFEIYCELLPAIGEYQLRSMTGNGHLHFFWQTLKCVTENIGKRDLKALLVGCSE